MVRLPVRTALLQNRLAVLSPTLRVRLPVRTALLQNARQYADAMAWCDYQSERHCSKTLLMKRSSYLSAITSQNGTAPKHDNERRLACYCAITSQNGTAPKR